MCGICGIASFENAPVSRDRLAAMKAAIVHRGPDDEGSYFSPDGHAALGFRRLSIIDLTTGHQPISNEDGTVWIIFNGEIYDFGAIRETLLKAGHRFVTKTDTECIVHLYEEYGPKCVDHLRGMFAFAIWDDRKKSLFIARDRVGKKPLYYTIHRGQLLFGSELKTFVPQLGSLPDIDPDALDQYLAFGYVPAPRTIYRGIYKLPPGHWMRYSAAGLEIQRYWELDFTTTPVSSEADLTDEVEKLLREAVRMRLMSDVPLGALLSGGVDSSIVVALMAQEGGQPPKTFSVGFEESDFSELTHARKVAKHIGTEHHEQVVHADIIPLMTELVAHYDEPFADSSMIPTYLVSRHAREHITVALSGDGGDEVFGGYPRYRYETWIRSALRIPGARLAAGALSTVYPEGWRGRQQLRKMRFDEGARYAEQISIFSSEVRKALYRPMGNGWGSGAEEFVRQHYVPDSRTAPWEPLARLQNVDIVHGWLPGDMLTKVDMASMRVSLEVRCPLLDHRLMEFMSRVPAEYKIRGRCTKYLLKKIGERLLPPEVLYRPKQGFSLPLPHWFRSELRPFVESMLLADDSRVRSLFRRETVREILQAHYRGLEYSAMIFSLVALESWMRQKNVTSEIGEKVAAV